MFDSTEELAHTLGFPNFMGFNIKKRLHVSPGHLTIRFQRL
jgi:hypothetical protein